MTKESGLAIVEKYGKKYFKQLRAKVKHESLVKAGRIGGKNFIKKYGKRQLEKVANIGRRNFKKKIRCDQQLQERFRKMFIERMKKFTKIYPIENGLKVRSQLEQEIANYLISNGIKINYETLALTTSHGICEPDFVVDKKFVIEVLGMDTDFYLNKKLPKLIEAINNSPQFRWIIFTLPNIKINLTCCLITSSKEDLLKFIKEEAS